MKENAFPKSTEPPGLVRAFLELDEGSSDSDEEYLDFQFRIADANANLQEREASEHMADLRASFASLQLKQAHEVAEFALARRREDESRIDRQAKEIIELRRTLEASKLETELVKANCVLLTEEKLKLEKELAHQFRICESFRENTTELSEAQERVFGENVELKRSLDEAAVTTGRLKVALEEKAAELVAWLGHEGLPPQGLSTQASENDISPKAEEKEAYGVPADVLHRLEDSQELECLLTEEEPFERISREDNSNEEEDHLTSATEKMIIALEEEFEDMKHEVLIGTSTCSDSREDLRDSCLSPTEMSRSELKGDGNAPDIANSKETKENLSQKISEFQFEIERLHSLESVLDEQQSNNGNEPWDVKEGLLQTSSPEEMEECHEGECRLSDSSSTIMDPEVIAGKEPALTVTRSDDICAEVDIAGDQLPGNGKPGSCTLDADAVLVVANEVVLPEMTEIQFSESFASLDHSEVDIVDSRNVLEDKFICVSRSEPWSIASISNLVESITEELTKLLREVVKTPYIPSQLTFTDMETRVQSWSNVTAQTLQSKVSRNGAAEEWKDLVVDFLCQSRQQLEGVQQRLCDCESELALMDKLQAECLADSQTISLLKDEIHRLEAQSFSDQIEREEEVNLLKEELEQAKQLIAAAHEKAAEEQQTVDSLMEQLQNSEIELENSKLGWAAEQEFINSCFGGGREEPDLDDKVVRSEEMRRMEKKSEDLMFRLEENERELGELSIISGVNSDAVVSAKIRRLEQRLEDAKASEEVLVAERAALAAEVDSLKVRLAEVEYELQLENQQHVEMLIQYEEEQDQLEASTRSETGIVNAKLSQMELLLLEKSKQLELAQAGQDLPASQLQLLSLRARVLTLESNLAVTRQKAVDCEAAIKSQINKEKEKYANLESNFVNLQSNFATLKTQLSETQQRERRSQINIDKLMVELGIAKEEVLRYEVRLQKTVRQAKEDVELEKRKHEETISSQKQMEWHLCRQLELTEGLEREKANIREVLVDYELQNLALQKESDNLRTAYMQLARRADQRGR